MTAVTEMTPQRLEPSGVVADGDQYADSTALVLDVESIIVTDRYRKEIGDVSDLKESIANVGLLNPITVREWHGGYRLVAGERRLTAFKQMGLVTIDARLARDIADARDALVAERDENTARKPMLPSEATALGMAIEEMEKPAAAERRASTLRQGSTSPVVFPGTQREGQRSRDIAAEAVGMSGPSFTRMKTIITAAENEDLPEGVREVAREALDDIDKGASIRNRSDRVAEAKRNVIDLPKRGNADQQAEKWEQIEYLALSGFTSSQIAKRFDMNENGMRATAKKRGIEFPADKFANTRRIDPLKVLENVVASIESNESALALVTFEDVTPELAAELLERLKPGMKAIRQLATQLKEIN